MIGGVASSIRSTAISTQMYSMLIPLNVRATSSGLEMGHTQNHVFAANDYLYPFTADLRVGMANFTAPSTQVVSYGDWTVTSIWQTGSKDLQATIGHGLPYVYFRVNGGEAEIVPLGSNSTVWHNQEGVLGITTGGKSYGVFAPAGSSWNESGTLRSSLNGKGLFFRCHSSRYETRDA